jgi:hypothetical protein
MSNYVENSNALNIYMEKHKSRLENKSIAINNRCMYATDVE